MTRPRVNPRNHVTRSGALYHPGAAQWRRFRINDPRRDRAPLSETTATVFVYDKPVRIRPTSPAVTARDFARVLNARAKKQGYTARAAKDGSVILTPKQPTRHKGMAVFLPQPFREGSTLTFADGPTLGSLRAQFFTVVKREESGRGVLTLTCKHKAAKAKR